MIDQSMGCKLLFTFATAAVLFIWHLRLISDNAVVRVAMLMIVGKIAGGPSLSLTCVILATGATTAIPSASHSSLYY